MWQYLLPSQYGGGHGKQFILRCWKTRQSDSSPSVACPIPPPHQGAIFIVYTETRRYAIALRIDVQARANT